MIRDWDLWPWMVAEGGGTLDVYRLARAIRSASVEVGALLYPVLRDLAGAMTRLLPTTSDRRAR